MKLAYVTLQGRGRTDALIAAVAQPAADGWTASCRNGAVEYRTSGSAEMRHGSDDPASMVPSSASVRIAATSPEAARSTRARWNRRSSRFSSAYRALTCSIVNKFGKREAEGRGLVPVIADAVDLGIPVLVGVNGLNLAAFLAFAGEDAIALPTDVASVVQWCRQSIVAETV